MMDRELKETLQQALIALDKSNKNLIEEFNYTQVSKNASTMSKIAEALSNEQATNIRL